MPTAVPRSFCGNAGRARPREVGNTTAALSACRKRQAIMTGSDAVKGDPELAKFQFRATNHWISGTHSESTLQEFYGAKQSMAHAAPYTAVSDHPAVLVGQDNGPTPVEFLLHALAACLTAGLANIAAARGVNLDSVESTVEGDIDLLGILGLPDEVRNGYERVRVSFTLRGDDPAKLR